MTPQRCSVVDLMGALTQRRITDEGFLVAPAKIARAGNIQTYAARELGLTGDGMDPDRLIKLYRPTEEVFSPKTIASFKNKTLTLEHPPKGVMATNWREVATGDVGDVAPADDHLATTVTVKDAGTVSAVVEDNTVQMSCGYDFDLDMTPGKHPTTGEAYDGIQRNIVGNHVAIVESARGGPGCRIADHNRAGGSNMALKVVARDKLSVSLEDRDAGIVEMMLGRAEDATAAAVKERDAAVAAKTTADAALVEAGKAHAAAAKDAADKLAAALDAAKPEKLALLIADRSALIADAKILAADVKLDGKTDTAVRGEVVAAVIAGDERLKPIAESILRAGGEKDPMKASDSTLRSVIAALVPLKSVDTGDAGGAGGAGGAGDDDVTRARDRALAGADDGGSDSARRAGAKPPRFVGMDAVNEAARLTRLGKIDEADEVLAAARQ